MSSPQDLDFDTLFATAGLDEHLRPIPPAILKLPVELLQYIIRIASSTPGCDEFGTLPQMQVKLLLVDHDATSFMDENQLKVAVQCRLTVAKVCRLWLQVSEPILWSHVNPAPRHLDGLLQTITDNPVLGSHIKRITIRYDDVTTLWDWEFNTTLSKHTSVLPFVLEASPRATVLSAPTTSINLNEIGDNVTHLILTFDCSRTPTAATVKEVPLTLLWITSLTINLVEWRIDDVEINPLELPVLVALGIYAPLYAHWNLETVIETWTLPQVTTLSVFGGRPVAVLKLIRKVAETLETLHLGNSYDDRWDSGRIEFPRLNRLDVTWTKMSEEMLKIIFPTSEGFGLLRALGIYWPDPIDMASDEIDERVYEQSICRSLKVVRNMCPQTTKLCLSGAQLELNTFPTSGETQDLLTELKGEGRMIEVIGQDGSRKVL